MAEVAADSQINLLMEVEEVFVYSCSPRSLTWFDFSIGRGF